MVFYIDVDSEMEKDRRELKKLQKVFQTISVEF